MKNKTVITNIAIDDLVPNSDNPNRMSKGTFAKLVGHIKRTGNYEPVVVRSAEGDKGNYQILNGHHRVKALKQLGYDSVDCVVWDVDEAEALLLLSTLNRLCGSDDVYKKSAIISTLSEKYSTAELAKMLPGCKKNIERLKDLSAKVVFNKQVYAFLNPVTFFLDDSQKHIFDTAIESSLENDPSKTAAQKRSGAVVRIAQYFNENTAAEKTIDTNSNTVKKTSAYTVNTHQSRQAE